MQEVGGVPTDSRPSRFGDRSYKPSVHNCATLTDAEYNWLGIDINGQNPNLGITVVIGNFYCDAVETFKHFFYDLGNCHRSV